jgi:AmiR/NasT family two-component response regulator
MRNVRGQLNRHDIRAAQALADVATIGILQQRTVRDAEAVRDQLQGALASRVLIEQAKGVVAETSRLSMDDAFQRIRQHARSHNATLASVAQKLVEGDLRL